MLISLHTGASERFVLLLFVSTYLFLRREANHCTICYAQPTDGDFQDFGISTGKKLACTYLREPQPFFNAAPQTTCGGIPTANKQLISKNTFKYTTTGGGTTKISGAAKKSSFNLMGKSQLLQRAESLMTITGPIVGSFVSIYLLLWAPFRSEK